MNESRKIFISRSKRFHEFVDWAQTLAYKPDAGSIHQKFDTPKRRLDRVDEEVKSGAMNLDIAEEHRLKIERPAWGEILKYVQSSWDSKDGLASVRSLFHRRVGQELEPPDVRENERRKEALTKFDDVLAEIVSLHETHY